MAARVRTDRFRIREASRRLDADLTEAIKEEARWDKAVHEANYLRAADAVFWKHPSPDFIRKTIGIQALFDVLADLLPDQLATKDLTEKAWRGWLTRAAKIDFTDRLFNASGSGRGRVKNALLISMARRTLDDVSPELRADFRRVLGLS